MIAIRQRLQAVAEPDSHAVDGKYLIQDYTMMKDYIAYKLMNEFGVVSPLVSYVYVTVNGEDWGLFLAVEAVEDSFLERNYGTDYGDLYKPDSMSMGGGRGNGGGFDMREVDFDEMGIENPFENGDWKKPEDAADGESSGDSFDPGNMDFSQMSPPDFAAGDSSGGGFPGGDFPGGGGFGGPTSSFNTTNLLCMGGWILLLVAGIVVAATYKRRRH